MADWCVSSSEPEDAEEGMKDEVESLEIGGLRIPPAKVLELMETVDKRKTFELDCLSSVNRHRKRAKKRKHKKHKSIGSPSDMGGAGGGANKEEVSETASEIRSNTSTTATECRDSRRPNLAMFDPTFDPELDDGAGSAVKLHKTKKAPPIHKHAKKLASLDTITANAIKSKQKWHKRQQNLTNQDHPLAERDHKPVPQPSIHSNSTHLHDSSVNPPAGASIAGISVSTHMESSVMEVDNGFTLDEGTKPATKELPSFRFDEDEDEDEDMSEMDMKFSVLSQIDRVEKLLDTEGLS